MQRLRLGGVSHVVIAGGLAALAAAEWLRGNAAAWAWAAGIAGLAAAAVAARRPYPPHPVGPAAARRGKGGGVGDGARPS